jgi:hypothetical protein
VAGTPHRLTICTVIASNNAILIATMIRKNFPKGHRFFKAWLQGAHAGNGLDDSAYRCVDVAARDRQNGCVHPFPVMAGRHPACTGIQRPIRDLVRRGAGPGAVTFCTYSTTAFRHEELRSSRGVSRDNGEAVARGWPRVRASWPSLETRVLAT